MKRFLILFTIVFCMPAIALATPSISSISGALADGNIITVNGSSFGSHPDYGGNGNFLCARWETWEGNNFSGMEGYVPWTVYGQISISSANQRSGSLYSMRHSWPDQVSWSRHNNQNQSGTYTAFWWRPSSNYNLSGGSTQEKINRVYSSGSSTYANYYFETDMSGSNVLIKWTHEKVSKPASNVTTVARGRWNFLECWVKRDLGAGNGVDQVWANGRRYINWSNVTSATNANYAGNYNFGNYFSGAQSGTYSEIDDIYISHTLARVVIGNNSSYSACTDWAIQPPVSWSDSSITITLNQGSFAVGETAYLFIVDADGNVNTQGYPVTFTLSGFGPPSPPTGLKIK